MNKLKIALTQGNYNGTSYELILRACEDPAMLELCTPVVYGNATAALAYRKALELSTNFLTIKKADEAPDGRLSLINITDAAVQVEMGSDTADARQQEVESQQAALADTARGMVDCAVLCPAVQPVACPGSAIEVIITEKARIMPIPTEPTIDDIVSLADILERDFDQRSPRIAIIQETRLQNTELAAQVTTEKGINTYGPYTAEQFLSENLAEHFDGIIVVEDNGLTRKLVDELSQEAPVRFFAGQDIVVTGVYSPARMHDAGKGITEISTLTRPIYTAIDIIRCRERYDEARRNPLPKLFKDKRDERRPSDNTRTFEKSDNTEKAS